jgi:Cu(I)/Ag(I) efflux system membrane fusion protein
MGEFDRSAPSAPSDSARPMPARVAGAGPRRRWAAYLAVSILSLAVGAGASVLALWWTGHLRPRVGSAAAGAAAGEAVGGAGHAHGGAAGGGAAVAQAPGEEAAGGGEGDRGVYISPARQQLIGVRTAAVAERALEATIRTVGTLAYDETKVAQIHTKIAGWVEQLFVDYVGKPVRRGQPLFTVYSPELVSTQHEFLLALEAEARLGRSQFAETRAGAASLVAAARERLKLWDISEAQIAELERTRQPRKTLTLYSPFDGIVLERNAYPGQYITPETMAFKIADLSTIWVFGYVYEYELPMVKVGQPVEAQFPYGSADRTLKGRITYIYPEIDPTTRRARIRTEFPNPGFAFKPESFVTLVIRAPGRRALAVPREAVIETGAAQYVILAKPGGYFEPRAVTVGAPAEEYFPVLSGLQAGDTVVTSAQFLIDSETNLQAAMRAMAGMPSAASGGEAAGAGAPAAGEAAVAPAPRTEPPPARVTIAFRTRPDPPQAGENTFEVTVTDAQGRGVTDASVEVVLFMPPMPSMGMPAMRGRAVLAHAGGGVYRGVGEIAMAGRWDVTVTVRRGGQTIGRRQTAIVVP